MYKIIEGLYQGGIPYDGLPDDVQAIVTLNERSTNAPVKAHLRMYVPDAEFPGVAWLTAVVACIHAFREAGLSVYVHCQMGISRSPMVTAAYLMRHHGLRRDAALEKVAKSNPMTDPNPRFLLGLKEWEQKILSG
jgi:protein-tyrosine phosphatase